MSVEKLRAYWVYSLILGAIAWLVCGGAFRSCAAAETKAPEEAAYRVSCGNSGGSGAGIGPTLGVTNAHVVDWTDGASVTFTHQFTGERFAGRVVVLDPQADVAICSLEGATEVTWVRVAESDPPIGTKLWMFGYGPQRILRGASGSILSANGTSGGGVPVLYVGIVSEPGDSGSGLYNEQAELCAVNWGGDGSSAAATPASFVRRAVEWGIANGRIAEHQWGSCPGGRCSPGMPAGGGSSGGGGAPMRPIQPGQPTAPRPEPQPPTPVPSPPPAKGEKGDKGDKGDPGPPGAPCDEAKLREVEIAAQRAAGEAEAAKRETENLGKRIDGVEGKLRESILAAQDTTIVLARIENRIGSLERKLSGQLRVRFRYDPATGELTPIK